MINGGISTTLAHLRQAVGELLAEPVSELAPTELASVLESLEVERRRLDALDQRLLAAASEVHLAGEFGRPGLTDVLTELLRIDHREAKGRVSRAIDLGPRRSLTGEPLEPLLPTAAAAAADGGLSSAQADVIIECLEKISPS